ncbi:MAG: hypothetical protein CMI01_13030 [Oceanospirillaceae bacterium]|nr:hypothetical protein [Oceanospirillaceae bacterium]
MPFNRAHSLTLLTLTTALGAAPAFAETDQRLWNCNLTPTDEWECDVNEALMEGSDELDQRPSPGSQVDTDKHVDTRASQPEPSPSVPATTPASTEATADASAPEESVANAAPKTGQAPPQAQTGSAQWDCNAEGERWACASQPVAANRTPKPGDVDSTALAQTGAQPWAHLDWYLWSPGEAGYGGTCSGRYIEPELNLIEANTPTEQQTIFLDALRSTTILGGTTQLEGGINVRQGGRLLSSDSAEYDPESRQASLFGQVRYREQGMLMVADQADADLNAGNASFTNAQYVMHDRHMRGSAERIARHGDSRVTLDNGMITFCDPGSNAWSIAAQKLELHTQEGYGEAYHARLEVADIPILYLPYFYFPIDDTRRTGFLYPSLGYSSSDGLDIATPYYFNLAPNYDDTLTPRYIEERGLVLENEFRYMNRWSMNRLATAYIADDNDYGDERWALGVYHDGNPFRNWYSSIDYSRTSDRKYLDDLGTTNLEIPNADDLSQRGEIRYQRPSWQFIGRVHQYQTTDNGVEPYERVPQLLVQGEQIVAGQDTRAAYLAEYAYFDRDNTTLTGIDKIVGSRVHLRPSLRTKWERTWGYIKPRLTYWHSQYDLNNQPAGWANDPSVGVAVASLDTGLELERSYGALTQTLEPRLKLISAGEESQTELPNFDSARLDFDYSNLFHETGYSGNDSIAGTRQATLGLASGFYAEDGIEQGRIAMAQAHYFQDRDPNNGLRPGDRDGTETRSNIALLARWNLTPALRLAHDSEIDDNSPELLQQNYRLTYQPDDQRLLYFSYRDNSGSQFDDPWDEVRQTDVAFMWPLSPAWRMIGRWQEDLLRDENLETLLGLEYQSCCWKTRVTARHWVTDTDDVNTMETDTGLFVQFVLRGLGSFGQDGGRKFLEEITGNNEDAHETF